MKKSDLELQNLKDCINSLKECESSLKADNIDVKMKNFIEDACIKRYEFTVETAWKTMKKYLKSEYGKSDKELTMNNIFRLMEGYNLIESWQKWREYYDRLNDTSHEYNKQKAKEVLKYLSDLIKDCEYLYEQLDFVLVE